jgi:hypothetical protein
MNPNDVFFIHKTSVRKSGNFEKFTKIEMSVLTTLKGTSIIQKNFQNLAPVSNIEIHTCARKQNALHLIAQLMKPNDLKQTEITKGFFRYNNAIYFLRIYKLIGADFAKTEITKVPLGQRAGMDAVKTVNGLTDVMKHVVRNAEKELLPHYLHLGNYETLEEFNKKFK